METWKLCTRNDNYAVSDLGNVRRITAGRGARTGAVLHRSYNNRYLQVTLSKHNTPKTYAIHHLVAEAFIGICPEGMECCHNNGDGKDCRLANLRYDTHTNNSLDSVLHGTCYGSKPRTAEEKAKISAALTGRKLPPEVTAKTVPPLQAWLKTPAGLEHQRTNFLGRKHTAATKAKIAAACNAYHAQHLVKNGKSACK